MSNITPIGGWPLRRPETLNTESPPADVSTVAAPRLPSSNVYSGGPTFFSTPTIKVQLAEAKKDVVEVSPVEVASAPTLEPVISKVNKKISIACVKGKVTKKVTTVKPKCPAGYKKK